MELKYEWTPSSAIGKYASRMARMPSQPSSCISRAWKTASAIVVAATPATTGTRPRAALTTISTTRRRWGQVRYANSPVDPSGVNPCTPAAIRSLQRRSSTSLMTSPEGLTGETRYGKTPWNAPSTIETSLVASLTSTPLPPQRDNEVLRQVGVAACPLQAPPSARRGLVCRANMECGRMLPDRYAIIPTIVQPAAAADSPLAIPIRSPRPQRARRASLLL